MIIFRWGIPFVWLMSGAVVYGADESLDDLMDGFEEETPVVLEVPQQAPTVQRRYKLSGAYTFSSSYNYAHDAPTQGQTDYRGLSRVKNKVDLQLDIRINEHWKARLEGKAFYDLAYQINGRSDYTSDVLDSYESEVEVVEAWIQGSVTEQLDFKLGRQITVWGKSDNIRITDIINPLDNREPGMTDIEDLRLPVLTSRFDYYPGGSWNLSALIVHESRTPKEATQGSDFLPLDVFPFPEEFVFPDNETPRQSLDNTQYGLALNGVFQGGDISLYAADVLDSRWHFEESNTVRQYGRVQMLGAAANVTVGSWLFKAELAALGNLQYNTTQNKKSRWDLLIGTEYMGFKDTSISLEIANRHINDYEAQMINPADFVHENELQTVLRATRSFNHDTIDITWLVSLFGSGGSDGGFQRLWLNYDISDGLLTTAGVVDYIGGNKPFMDALSDNGRVFAEIKYSF
ncbi:MAG TPA: DUF1302 family protein [Gammaproteobacteria bacterium]|nr:DUF1302 family protein [Gammaproteobacteria bacterium]